MVAEQSQVVMHQTSRCCTRVLKTDLDVMHTRYAGTSLRKRRARKNDQNPGRGKLAVLWFSIRRDSASTTDQRRHQQNLESRSSKIPSNMLNPSRSWSNRSNKSSSSSNIVFSSKAFHVTYAKPIATVDNGIRPVDINRKAG